ncbi:MAG: hypothetical protein ACI8QC_002548 [Planctomycetota bacterium]|jgi:hypothetical protein
MYLSSCTQAEKPAEVCREPVVAPIEALPMGRLLVGLGLVACLSACSGGSGGGGVPYDPDGGGSGYLGVDDGSVGAEDVVATLVMEAPEARDFILSATLPVPRGTLTDGAMTEPLSVRANGDRAAATQVEIVSRYPDPADGADVVRILAHVRRPGNSDPGDMIRFEVGRNQHSTHEIELNNSVRNFIKAPGSLMLMTKDAYGNPYSADLLRGVRADNDGSTRLIDGHVARTMRTHEVLLPDQVVEGSHGTLPHMMGVHTYLTAWRGERFLSLDLHVHNGMDGLDQSTSNDDALGNLYFQDLVLRLPSGWRVGYNLDTPASGNTSVQGEWAMAKVIRARGDGTLHILPQLGQFVRRLVIFQPSVEERAMEMVHSGFQAFCKEGNTPSGGENWSWWNENTARYYPQNHTLPNLEFIGIDEVRGQLEQEFAQSEQQVTSGSAGGYPMETPRLGWAHPWGSDYGGMTGGDEIDVFAGMEIAATASNAGYRQSQLMMRCYVDRQTDALYDLDGEYTSVEDVLVTEGFGAPYADIWFNGKINMSNDPFGFANAPLFQEVMVQNQGLAAPYSTTLLDYDPIDHQHFIRHTRNLKTLTWLGGDALSMDLLKAAGEGFRLGFHEYNNSAYGHTQPTGLRKLQDHLDTYPGQGVGFGRGQAWGMDAALSAYATGTLEHRALVLPWMRQVSDVIQDGQSTCTGNIMAMHINKYWNGAHMTRQAMEESFIENMLRSLDTTVFASVEPARSVRLQEQLVASVRSTIEGPFWNSSFGAPWFYSATGSSDSSQGEYCLNVPSSLHSNGTNTTAYYSSFAYAFELDPDPIFMFRAAEMMGGGNLWSRLDNKGLNNLNNSAALVALCQLLGEDTP